MVEKLESSFTLSFISLYYFIKKKKVYFLINSFQLDEEPLCDVTKILIFGFTASQIGGIKMRVYFKASVS